MNFTPGIYEHAARFADCSPWQASRDGELLFRAHAGAYRKYRHAPVVAGIDIYNVEAESLGAVVENVPGSGVPAICNPVFHSSHELLRHLAGTPAHNGRCQLVLEAATRLRETFPGADIRVPVSGPFSLATHLLGFRAVLEEAIQAPMMLAATVHALALWQMRWCEAISGTRLGIIVFESAASPPLLSPSLFRTVELPALNLLLRSAHRCSGAAVPCILGGNTAIIVDALLESGAGGLLCPAETDQQRFLLAARQRPEVHVRVNMQTQVFLGNDAAAALREARRALKLAALHPNASVGTGVLPYDANPDLVEKVKALVTEWKGKSE